MARALEILALLMDVACALIGLSHRSCSGLPALTRRPRIKDQGRKASVQLSIGTTSDPADETPLMLVGLGPAHVAHPAGELIHDQRAAIAHPSRHRWAIAAHDRLVAGAIPPRRQIRWCWLESGDYGAPR